MSTYDVDFRVAGRRRLTLRTQIDQRIMPLEKRPPRGAVSEGVNSPTSARGSVRYGARFHRFSYSSSKFSMATAMLC